MMAKVGDVGTLKELGVRVGDVVVMGNDHYDKMTVIECPPRVGKYFHSEYELEGTFSGEGIYDGSGNWRIISRATTKPKLWRDMTPEEKGSLLLAMYEGKFIEYYTSRTNIWHKWNSYIFDDNGCVGFANNVAYRIKSEPKVETVTWYSNAKMKGSGEVKGPRTTHRITFNTIDGKPDCASIKMDEL